MKRANPYRARGRTHKGRCPSLSVETTRERPPRCPARYAYEPEHPAAEVGADPEARFAPLRSLYDAPDPVGRGPRVFGGAAGSRGAVPVHPSPF